MIIEDKRSINYPCVGDLECGSVFEHQGNIYMKCSLYEEYHSSSRIVRLSGDDAGRLYCVNNDTPVTNLHAKLILI